jgi:lysophospholipase L1-like esterase
MTLVVPFSLEGAGGWANFRRRQRFFEVRNDPGYRGPIIVAEGDSWFCYPVEFILTPWDSPTDVIKHLQRDYAVLSCGIPGALARQYRSQFDVVVDGQRTGLAVELETFQPDVLLLSGGGNDLLGDLGAYLPEGNLPLERYLAGDFRDIVRQVIADLEWVADKSVSKVVRTDLAVIFNGYDEGVPGGGKGGGWLKPPMDRLGIPAEKQQPLVNLMIARFNAALCDLVERLHKRHKGRRERFAVAETWGKTGRSRWYNEIHPNSDGFRDVADAFALSIERAIPRVA